MRAPVSGGAEGAFWDKLISEVERAVGEFHGVISVALKDLASNRSFSYRGDLVQAAGSSIKIPILMELFRKANAGLLDLDQIILVKDVDRVAGSGVLQHLEGEVGVSLRNHAILMINLSDNISTNICTELAGMGATNELMTSLGYSATKLQRFMIGTPPDPTLEDKNVQQQVKDCLDATRGRENVTTADDMVGWLEVLVRGRLVDHSVSNAVLSVLRKPKMSPIRAAVAAPISIASKTGGLEGARCEVALVEQERRPYILAVMTTFGVDGDNSEAITNVARIVHRYLGLWERYTEFGRGLPSWAFRP